MGSLSIPAAPAAPNYAEANKSAIETDISTLALRNQITQAAQLGQKVTYLDPVTNAEKTADFTGMGNAAAAQQAADILNQQNAALAQQQYDLRQKFGVLNAQQTRAELEAADPAAFATRDALTNRILGDLEGPGSALGTDTSAAALAGRLRGVGVPEGTDRLGSIYDSATRLPTEFGDDSALFSKMALLDASREYGLGGRLDAGEMTELQNATRAGQVARGNFLGDAAAVAEASTLGSAQATKKQQRLQNLLGIQGQVFGQNDTFRQQGQAARLARLGQLSGLAQQMFGNENTTFGNRLNSLQLENSLNQAQLAENKNVSNTNYARDQQRLANASAMVLGQPLTNQFGALGAASTGAAPAGGGVNYAQVGGLNPNAGAQGAQFAQGNFGTQANMWGTQANIAAQGNPWMSLAGNVLGSAAGSAFGAGGRFGRKS